jgi:hypothetical protein
MIYIHAAGIHNSIPSGELSDLKTELKTLSGKSYRRIDRFIQLALIGAHKAVAGYELESGTALYLISGQGDIPVFERVRRQRYFQKMMSKPVDFVNLAGNTAGFYVSSHLGIAGANLFLAHNRFPVQMALLLAQSDLELKKQSAILLGGVDEWLENQELAKKLLGVSESVRLGEGSNWLLLKGEPAGALASLQVDCGQFDLKQIKVEIGKLEPGTRLAFSWHMPASAVAEIMALRKDLRRFEYESNSAYYETLPLYVLNKFLAGGFGKLFHIDSDGAAFMGVRLERDRCVTV